VATSITLIGASDRQLEELVRGQGIRIKTLAVSDLLALAQPTAAQPDVVILDIRDSNSLPPTLSTLKRQHPSTGVVIVAARMDPVLMLEAMRAGVNDQSTALIFGAGPIGIGLWFALRGMGLTEIDVVEPNETRRKTIGALGARTLDPTSQDVSAIIADRTNGSGVDAAFDAAGVAPAVAAALESLGEQRPLISVAIYDKPLPTPLFNLVVRERRIEGTFCYTSADYEAVIKLMERGLYDTTGWVDTIPIGGVVEQGFEALRAGRKMKLLVDPSV